MGVAFPLNPLPAHYRVASFPDNRCGIYYVGATVTITLSAAGPDAYTVRDYDGVVVSTGSITGTTVSPTPPAGGWKPGWYRIYFTGAASDTLFGASHGATNFVVLRNDPRFPALPASGLSNVFDPTSDVITKGLLGMGTDRLFITNPASPAGNIANIQADMPIIKGYWAAPTNPSYIDTVRSRPLWTNFDNDTSDYLNIGTWIRVFVRAASVDGKLVFVSTSAGTTGMKLQVAYPNAATVVETYDNILPATTGDTLAARLVAANSLVRAFNFQGGSISTTPQAATAIGSANKDGVIASVTALYPDVKYFEGPANELRMDYTETVHKMKLFSEAVHSANPAAKAIGPCPVDISTGSIRPFLTNGGGAYCDGFAFHDYNSMTNGNLGQGRAVLSAFIALLAEFGQSGKELWQTEAGAAFSSVYGVYHPRRCRVKMLHTLLWEQYGVPHERNTYWYDKSHGFWSYPTWWQNGDTSLNPDAALCRTLAEEIFGKTLEAALSFGFYGDRVLVGNQYAAPDTSKVIVLQASSWLPNASVTFTMSSAAQVTAVDAFGNLAMLTPDRYRNVVVPLKDVPSYLRVPAGVTATVFRVNDWPEATKIAKWTSASPKAVRTIGANAADRVADDTWPNNYDGTFSLVAADAAGVVPTSAVLAWPTAARFDRVLIWAGQAWQVFATLLDFDIQTSNNGTTWTTQKTVTKATPSSFQWGTSYHNVGCQRETFWDEQWIFDVKLDVPVTAKYMRLYVRTTSYGGEPDLPCLDTGGQGASTQQMVLAEVAVLCDDNAQRGQWATL